MREFRVMQKGYLKRLEDEQIHQWNMLRTMAVYVLQPHLKKGKSIKPSDILKLPIDKQKNQLEDLETRRKKGQFIVKKRELLAKEKSKNPQSSKLSLFDKVKK
jgi:hypothetical protein